MITKQGTLKTGSNILVSIDSKKNYINKLISLNNPVAYNIEIQKYDSVRDNTVTLCKFNLAAGDTVLNTSPYFLSSRDRLIIISSAPNTNYIISLEEVK